ncbi:unnamed protein product [Owenia fusiformis]|uniref:Uncharacterized protein n=1 Tax=Owenia fusiformis TaxID=6347 RepID=A0A8S4NQL3_OWEFU|nr:unnamed protein product [Owenia fusiformis]
MNFTLAAVICLLAGIAITDGILTKGMDRSQNGRRCCHFEPRLDEICPKNRISCCQGFLGWKGGCFRLRPELEDLANQRRKVDRKEYQLFEKICQWLPRDTNYENRLLTLWRDLAALGE